MNEFPAPNSVIVMDNCSIHHDAQFIHRLRNEFGVRVEFLPPYSPDLNPIEEAFSSIKAWIRRHNQEFEERGYSKEEILLHACNTVMLSVFFGI